MSNYIEIRNWDAHGPRTFLVHSFNMASQCVKTGKFGSCENRPDPQVTEVNLHGNYSVKVEIAIGYEDFKRALLAARAENTIPSFNYIKKTEYGKTSSPGKNNA